MKISCPACCGKIDIRPHSDNDQYNIKFYSARCKCGKFSLIFKRHHPQQPIRLYEVRFKENYHYLRKKTIRPPGLSEADLNKFFKKLKALNNFT